MPETAQPGDFLIITRNTTNLSQLRFVSSSPGVPHQVTGGTSLNEGRGPCFAPACERSCGR